MQKKKNEKGRKSEKGMKFFFTLPGGQQEVSECGGKQALSFIPSMTGGSLHTRMPV